MTVHEIATMQAEFIRLENEKQAQLAELQGKIDERKAVLQKRWDVLKTNPDLLAAYIASQIRTVEGSVSATRFENHDHEFNWNQQSWGEIRAKNVVELPEIDSGRTEEVWDSELCDYKQINVPVYAATCATTACIAGHAGIAVGYQMVISEGFWTSIANGTYTRETVVTAENFLVAPGKQEAIPDVAGELLRCDDDQCNYLFAAHREKEEVLAVLDMIASGNYDWAAMTVYSGDIDQWGDYDCEIKVVANRAVAEKHNREMIELARIKRDEWQTEQDRVYNESLEDSDDE